MCPPLVLLLITIIQATLALSQPSKTWKVLEAVVENGLYGWNLTIIRGLDILCDIPAVFSPHSASCNDTVSSVFLHSSNFLNLITEATNKTYFLEYHGKSPQLNDSESFASQEEACNYVYRMGNLTDPSRRKAEDSTDSDEDLLLLKILLPIILIAIIIIIAVIAVIAVFRWKKGRHQRGENRPIPGDQNHNPEHPEHQPLNSQNTCRAPPISNTQNDTQMTHGNGVLSGQYSCMVSMDSNF